MSRLSLRQPHNKMFVSLAVDGWNRRIAAKQKVDVLMAFEAEIHDEHERSVAHVEIRRQPDNEITLAVHVGEELVFEGVVHEGAWRRKADA